MIIFSSHFNKDFKKLPKKLQDRVLDRLDIFEINEFAEILFNHKLTGKYENCRSINVTGDYRVIYRKLDDTTYYLKRVGTHAQLYG